MKNKLLFTAAFLGLVLACVAAYLFSIKKPAPPPLFSPATNPYAQGTYAEGIVESDQASGSNASLYPEVPGTVAKILVHEGDVVHAGQPLLQIDDSIQRATEEQQVSAAAAAGSLLDELRAEPRKETLDVASAQVVSAQASLKTATDEWRKQDASYRADPRTVSKDALDAAMNARSVAQANLIVANRQYDLTKAGAWIYDIRNQQLQYDALRKSAAASLALLSKYVLHAPYDGTVLYINTTPGSYISPQGAYDLYTESSTPVIILSAPETRLHVRCYIDEILIPRLPEPKNLKAKMTIRGTNISVPLKFERVQPFVSPKIELSDQRQERVDVRVLPVIFSFDELPNVKLYPGELVDVYVGN